MKNNTTFYWIVIVIVIIISCTKQDGKNFKSLILAGIQMSKSSEIVCINIDSGVVVNSTPIDCYVLGSTVYDPLSGGYGYVNCDTVFKLVNPETGTLIKSIKLPGFVSQAVIDVEDNMLIGGYSKIIYHEEPDTIGNKSAGKGEPTYDNFVIRVDLEKGEIVSNKQVDIGGGIYVSSYYYNQKEKGYVIYRADQYLITVNPLTGAVIKEVYVGRMLFNSVYNPDNNTIISMTYSSGDDRNYVEVIDPETGSVLSSKIVDKEDSFCSNISGFDAESNCYITVNGDYEVLFYDISTGKIKKSYKLDNQINDIKFWRE